MEIEPSAPEGKPGDKSAAPLSTGETVRADIASSVVVFLVALPLCMGVAIASGVEADKAAAVGIISGIVGGLLVGLLSGCPLQVTGPAAGLAVIVGQLIQEHGMATLGLIIMVAGAVQLLAGILRLGQWFRAVSPAIVQGMLAGIGVLIVASQFHLMADMSPPGSGKPYGGVINLIAIPQAVWSGLTEQSHQPAAILGVVTILVIVGWTALAPKRLKAVPAPLLGVVAATVLAAVMQHFGLDPKDINVPDRLTDAVTLPAWEDLPRLLEKPILVAGLTLAFIASAETLLTATAVDTMQQHAPRTNYDRELAAQGLGNMLCGVLGALPLTGVIVRSGANVHAGGRTRLATMLHGAWLLVFVVAFTGLLRMIPVASLAAVLVYTGFKLVNVKAIRELAKYGWGELAVYFLTLGAVVLIDLLTGIVLGLGLALAQLVHRFSHLAIRTEADADGRRIVLHLEGAATFLRLPMLATALQGIPRDAELVVQFAGLTHIDHACLDLLMKWEKQHQATGGRLIIDWTGLSGRYRSQPAVDV